MYYCSAKCVHHVAIELRPLRQVDHDADDGTLKSKT